MTHDPRQDELDELMILDTARPTAIAFKLSEDPELLARILTAMVDDGIVMFTADDFDNLAAQQQVAKWLRAIADRIEAQKR